MLEVYLSTRPSVQGTETKPGRRVGEVSTVSDVKRPRVKEVNILPLLLRPKWLGYPNDASSVTLCIE